MVKWIKCKSGKEMVSHTSGKETQRREALFWQLCVLRPWSLTAGWFWWAHQQPSWTTTWLSQCHYGLRSFHVQSLWLKRSHGCKCQQMLPCWLLRQIPMWQTVGDSRTMQWELDFPNSWTVCCDVWNASIEDLMQAMGTPAQIGCGCGYAWWPNVCIEYPGSW